MILADAITASNNDIGLFVVCAATIIALAAGLVSLASYFATRREVDDLKDRVVTIEELLEKRTANLHRRINRILAGQMLIAGHVGVSLDKHEAQMRRALNELEAEEDEE